MWLQILGLLAGGIAGVALLSIAVDFFLDKDTLKETVRKECPDAFKMLIKEKKKKAVNVSIFDEDNEHLDDMEITASKGVSRNLRKGQTIYL